MSYKVLNSQLLPVGDLILENNRGATNFWADQVSRQIAQDDSNNDPASTMSMTLNTTDAHANSKLWNHTLAISFDNTEDVGSKVVAQSSSLLYQDENTGRYYQMAVYQSEEYDNYRTAQAQNAAIIELSKCYTDGKTFNQARLEDVVKYVFSYAPWSANIADDSGTILDSYVIDAKTSIQAIIQDLQVKYNVDVDAYVELDINGRINNRVVSFEHIGQNNGAKIWYGSNVKGAESIVRTGVSDTLYTKYHISGVAKDGDTNAGSIKSVNGGKDYLVDNDANALYNPVGAGLDKPTYLEVYLENTLLSSPDALLSWGKKVIELFNHPRYNYTVTSMHDADYSLGDTVIVNDQSKKPALVISSRVIQVVSSQANPETNTITLGEFSNLLSVKNEQASTILTIKRDITIAQNAALNAIDTAKLAQDSADKANQAAQTASQKIDTTMATEKSRVDGLLDKQTTKIQGVVKDASDYTDSAKAEVLNKAQSMADEAQDGAVAQSKVAIDSITNWVKDSNGNLSSSMMTALFNTTALKDFDKNSSVKSQTANMISSAVSDSENGMRSLISQKADSTVIGTISDDVNALKKSTQWEQIAYDDLNFLKTQGNYLITSGAGTNSPIQPWFYITVDVPRGDRITQHIWKDLDASASYSRTFNGSSWTAWIQIANSSTLLSIFNDQWSLGTSINTSIGQKIATGIAGLPDGTLALTGKSIHLTGDTIVDGSFMTKALATQDATIGKTLTLGNGGVFKSDSVYFDEKNFALESLNIHFINETVYGNAIESDGYVALDGYMGALTATGTTTVNHQDKFKYLTQIKGGNLYLQGTGWSDGSKDKYVNLNETNFTMLSGSRKTSDAESYTNIGAGGISTKGQIWSDGPVTSGNIVLNGAHSINSADGGAFYFNRKADGSGGLADINAQAGLFGNIFINAAHGIQSNDGGKMYMTTKSGLADLGVKSLTQSSLVSTKEHIGNVDPEYALSETLKADIRQYNFKGDPTDNIHVTPMIDDVQGKMYIPKDWISYEGDSVDTYSIIGYLVQSVKALQSEIDELKGK